MTLDTRHPDLEAEQAHIDRAYACMAQMAKEAAAFGPHGVDIFEREAFERWKAARLASLSDTRSVLVFGRIDTDDSQTHYIGRQHVRDDAYDPVVVDWRAPAAVPFYQARGGHPMDLRRRRHFLADGHELLAIADDTFDDTFDAAASSDGHDLRAPEILRAELDRRRGAHMRDIVTTIQAEQDMIIRAPLDGILVVQGGPGTGKTAIGLHRAAYLLYQHREALQRSGILVVGPNPVFIQYVSQVLPSLGEWAITQVAVDNLAPFVRLRGHDDPQVARIKGDERMAAVLARGLRDRWGTQDADVQITLDGVRFGFTAQEANADAQLIRDREVPYASGREVLREQLLLRAYRAYEQVETQDALRADFEVVARTIRRDKAFRRCVDRLWPATTAPALVGSLLRSPATLKRAGGDLLTVQERRVLRRRREGRDEPWTASDRPLVDEAQALIDGPPSRYGHVVVDEAQDLSPMQLRMLARRCPPAPSMTVLGDLAQATGVWAHDDWPQVLAHLPDEASARVEELTLGYRVGAEIMQVASRVLHAAAPGIRAPEAVRSQDGGVAFVRTDDLLHAAAEHAGLLADASGSVGVIAPDVLLDDAALALRTEGIAFTLADQHLGEATTLVGVSRCKGLEFDAVVVVEPEMIAQQGGLRLLYVALTRAMRALTIVHARPLPPGLHASE